MLDWVGIISLFLIDDPGEINCHFSCVSSGYVTQQIYKWECIAKENRCKVTGEKPSKTKHATKKIVSYIILQNFL